MVITAADMEIILLRFLFIFGKKYFEILQKLIIEVTRRNSLLPGYGNGEFHEGTYII